MYGITRTGTPRLIPLDQVQEASISSRRAWTGSTFRSAEVSGFESLMASPLEAAPSYRAPDRRLRGFLRFRHPYRMPRAKDVRGFAYTRAALLGHLPAGRGRAGAGADPRPALPAQLRSRDHRGPAQPVGSDRHGGTPARGGPVGMVRGDRTDD